MRQKQINKMLRKVKCAYTPYTTYGKIIFIPLLLILVFIICFVTPCTNWIIPLVYSSVVSIWVLRINIHNKINEDF
jgi:hypothetical protein